MLEAMSHHQGNCAWSGGFSQAVHYNNNGQADCNVEEGRFRGAPGKGRSRDRRTRRLRERTRAQISAAPSAKVKESARRSEPLRADGELMQRKQNYETVEGRCLIWRLPYCRAPDEEAPEKGESPEYSPCLGEDGLMTGQG